MSWGSVASAGPPPTTPLPPIPSTPNSSSAGGYAPSSYAPSVVSDGKRKSVTLNSPTMASYPFPSKFDMMATPTSTTFNHSHRSSPSGATFGHGVGPNFSMRGDMSRAGDHSRGSSFGSVTEGGGRGGTSTVGDFGEFKLGMNPNGSVTTFGGDFSEDLPTRKPRHVSNFSTSTTTSIGTAAAAHGIGSSSSHHPLPTGGMKRVDSWRARDSLARESFQGKDTKPSWVN